MAADSHLMQPGELVALLVSSTRVESPRGLKEVLRELSQVRASNERLSQCLQ